MYVLAWKQHNMSNFLNPLWQPRISAEMSDGDINPLNLLLKMDARELIILL